MIHLICPNPAIDRTLLVKSFSSATPNRPYEVKEFPGGKSFNVAYAMMKENPDADFCIHTIIGGYNGDYLKDLANKRGINIVETRVEQNTRFCNIVVDTDHKTIYPIYEQGLKLTDGILKAFNINILSRVTEGDIVVFSGSLMKGMPDNYLAEIGTRIKNKNAKIFIDTSGKPLVEAYKAKPDMIKINDEELQDLFPGKYFSSINDYLALLKDIVDIPYFIITLGEKGVIAKMESEYYHLEAKKIIAKNPIASGDFFLGILTNSIVNNISTEESLKLAIAYSTANCLNWYPGVLSEDIRTILETVTINRI